MNYEGEVIYKLEELLECSTSDAQGVLMAAEMNGYSLEKAEANGVIPEKAAKIIAGLTSADKDQELIARVRWGLDQLTFAPWGPVDADLSAVTLINIVTYALDLTKRDAESLVNGLVREGWDFAHVVEKMIPAQAALRVLRFNAYMTAQ